MLLPTASELVNIRIKVVDREYFGTGLITCRYAAVHELADVEIIGEGKLAYRKTG